MLSISEVSAKAGAKLVLVLASLLAGCTNMPRGEPAASLNDSTKGIVMAAVSFKRTSMTNNSWFYVRKKSSTEGGNDGIRLSAVDPLIGPFTINLKQLPILGNSSGDFPDMPLRVGRVTAIALEPGEYELYAWGLYVNAFGGYGYVTPKAPPPPLGFTVKAGEVTYLGALHGETIMGRNLVGLPVVASGYPIIEDKRSRDEPMFRSRFPMLANWPITSANLNGQLWVQGDVDRQFTPTPMPTPVTK